ncbi:MAG TPA: glycoside hydrolase family 172 protein [Phycisphaerae bacterium]|nr:glycoside hydrolase family 172 protein [Phycisphaerae bacterium]
MNARGMGLTAWVLLVAGSPAPAVITVDSLLDEMTDLARLIELPAPPYVTRQFSSYDRKSVSATQPEGWFANADRGQYLQVSNREGRGEYVLMDADGPGAIVRIWSANAEGRIRVYLDDNPEPTLDAPMAELLGGEMPGLPAPLGGRRARGWNLYFPIPYAKHCRITCDAGSLYYCINYRTYPAGTEVTTFTKPDIERLACKIRKTAERLGKPMQAGDPGPGVTRHSCNVKLPPNAVVPLAELTGPATIAEMRLSLSAADMEIASAGVVLSIDFDGEHTVESPLGDFFGTAPGLNPYESLPMGVTASEPRTMWCHWRMPFARSARVVLKNLSTRKAAVAGQLVTMPYTWTDRSLLFHAKWRIQRDLPSRPFVDWTHLQCAGAGRFVGGMLHIANPVREWWGEGDEKIYADGEAFPSFFGTGSEDYYGYAWGSGELFSHGYHNQMRCDGPGSYGHTSVNRFHIVDDIPFSRQFRFDMEHWHWGETARTMRSAVSYWYARPGGTDFFQSITVADVVPVEVPRYVARREPGAIEGEDLKVLEKTGGRTRAQELMPPWSNEKQLWWTDAQPGDKLVVAFNSIEGGVRRVVVRLTRASDYGQVQLHVNNHQAGGVIDLYSENLEPTDEIVLWPCDLVVGENRLMVEIVGANPKARPGHMFGLDYVKLP